MNLSEYAKGAGGKVKPGPTSWLADIAEHQELVDAWAAGITPTVIRRWLTAAKPAGCGYGTDVVPSVPSIRSYLTRWFPR